MSNDLTYLSPEGHTVFKSQYLKNRGTCCKSACLHCPYGFTLKKSGLQFIKVEEQNFAQVEEILSVSGIDSDWKAFYPENIFLISIKDVVCGLMLKNHIIVKQLILLPHFKDQGLSKELVESYFFI
ncbi:MAG: DUF5522 domain-containing protein [Bacteriovoracia bacterium]